MSSNCGVYIMGNWNKTLYTGMSGDLSKRVHAHKNFLISGFTKKYKLNELLYFEFTEDTWQALIREKKIKNMNRAEKLCLIRKSNPQLIDLYGDLLGQCV